MAIDWFTAIAQSLNFVVLIWLLRRFLYQPILGAIDAREKLIATELAQAAGKMTEAAALSEEFRRKNDEFDSQRADRLNEAVESAKAERLRSMEEARKAADATSAKRRDALRTEIQNLDQAIRHVAQQEIFATVRKALTDLADEQLEERICGVFIRRLQQLSGKAKEDLANAVHGASQPALLRSAFDLSAERRAEIQDALNAAFSIDVQLRFETAPKIIGGIEFSVNGNKAAWSIADYMASLEKGVDALLNTGAGSAGTEEPDQNAPFPGQQ